MRAVGIIAEYNPFHNGHAYLIEEAKRLSGADRCIIVMSGDFVQRGAPAICDKYMRTKMALESGADVVFEIPVAYACASAEIFAEAGIKLLRTLGCVDTVVFGSECGDINKLSNIATLLLDEPAEYKTALSDGLKSGLPFPAAREAAFLSMTGNSGLAAIMREPNNILGIEYCKAALRLGDVAPKLMTVRRIGNKYNEALLANLGDDSSISCTYPSALAIRNELEQGDNSLLDQFEGLMPPSVFEDLKAAYGLGCPITANDFSDMLGIRLLTMSEEELADIMDMNSDLLNIIQKHKSDLLSFTGLADAIKSRNLTYSGISRLLMHIVLGISRSFIDDLHTSEYLPYARLLGLKTSSSAVLRDISDNPNCNLITKLADADRTMPLLALDIRAAECYSKIVYRKFEQRSPSEFEAGTVRI